MTLWGKKPNHIIKTEAENESKKSKAASKKKLWICPSSLEIYREPIADDQMDCVYYRDWWHQACTDYTYFGQYKYDLFVSKMRPFSS